jgi:hypothetical protein
MDQIGSKDPSRDLQLIYAISYLFYQHLMLHACVQKIYAMEREWKNRNLEGEENQA